MITQPKKQQPKGKKPWTGRTPAAAWTQAAERAPAAALAAEIDGVRGLWKLLQRIRKGNVTQTTEYMEVMDGCIVRVLITVVQPDETRCFQQSLCFVPGIKQPETAKA